MPTIRISTGSLHVQLAGQGPPLLLVHGFPLDHSMWQPLTESLSDQFQVIAPDLRGFGRSDVTDGVVTMQQYATDLAELLDVLEIRQPITLGGLSMGGYIALAFWKSYQARLDRLILCDTRAAPDSQEAAEGREQLAQRVLKDGSAIMAPAMLPKVFAADTFQRQPALVEATRQVIRSTAPAGIAAALRGMAARPDMRPLLSEIHVPTLLVVGQEDAITPASEMREMAGAMPHSYFIEIPDAGHLAPAEQPEPVLDAVRQFLM